MVTISERNIPGKLLKIRGNEPILLDKPHTWLILSGEIALFAVKVKNGAIASNRRYLFTCQARETLWGTLPSFGKTTFQLLASPIGEAELLQIDRQYLADLVANGDRQIGDLVDNWINKLGTILATPTLPKIEVRAEKPGRFSLNHGETLQPSEIIWLEIQQGYLCWLGREEFTLTSATAYLPINSQMWLKADGAVQITAKARDSILDLDFLITGLSQMHQLVLDWIQSWETEAKTLDLQRLSDRERLNRKVTFDALKELSAPLIKEDAGYFSLDSPLLVAAGAVGKYLGATIHPPSTSEDPQRVKQPLLAIANSSRLRLRQVLLRGNWWQTDSGPLVAYTKAEQPVALLPFGGNRYQLLNPTNNNRTLVDRQIAAELDSVAYMFYRSLPDKTLKVIDVLKFALHRRGKDLLVIMLTGIAATLLGMFTPYTTSILIDNAIPDSDRGLLFQIGGGLVIAALTTALFRLAQGYFLLRIETTSDAFTQAAVWDRLLDLPVAFFRSYTTGDLQSRVSSVNAIRRRLGGATLIKLVTGLFALLNIVLLFYYSVKLAFIALAVAITVMAVTAISGVVLVKKVRPLLELEGNIFGQTVQLINGIAKLRVSGAEERAFATWGKNYSRQIKLELSTQLIEDLVSIFNAVMPTIVSGVLFWFTVKLLTEAQTNGEIALTVGTFLAFNTALRTFINGATNVSNTVTDTLEVVPQWQRAQPILETIPEVEATKADPGKLIGRIAIDNVSFRYRPSLPLTLEKVSIHVEPGEFIALVGGSGSGKSTLFRLLLGFEIPEYGSIYYDGQDLSGLDISIVRRQLGVVLQAGKIMSGSIFDILAGGAKITLDEAWEAVTMSGLKDDLAAMPMGMHTVVSEGGSNLSGGQRQRLLIAKALVLKPQILLFDEATSALDNKTQTIVSESLDRLKVTRLVIAHRLSTIRNADRIYVLDSGRIAQKGNFEKLASQKGIFACLMKRQLT